MKKSLWLFCAVCLLFAAPAFADESAPSNESCVSVDKRDLPAPTNLTAVYNDVTGEDV